MIKLKGRRLVPLEQDVIYNNLRHEYSKITTRYIVRRLSENNYEFRNQQAAALYDILKTDIGVNISIRKVAKYNEVDQSNLSKFIRNSERKNYARKTKLTSDQIEFIIKWIESRYREKNPVSIRDMRIEIFEKFNIAVSKNWFRYLFIKYPNSVMIGIAHPQDEKRLNVSKTTAKKHISNLLNYVNNIPTELILNLDEASSSDWQDKRSKKVIVPFNINNERIEYAVERCSKKITICATISMAGDVLPPLIISNRVTIDQEIYDAGWREGQDFVYYHQKNSFMTKEIFQNYIFNHIIPYIDNTRKMMKLEDSPGVLLIDNCPSHQCDEIYKELANNNIRLITFPPHTTNLFQPLDLVTFGIFKQEKSQVRSKYKKGSQIDIINKNLIAMERATTSSNNRSAFYRSGLMIQASIIPNVACIREQYLNDIVDHSQLNDYENENCKVTFGWVNKEYFTDND